MARNFTGTATTSDSTLTLTGGFCGGVYVKNTGGVDLLVSVPRVHGDADFDTVSPGDTGTYTSRGDIKTIVVKTSSSTTTYSAGATHGTA